MVDTLQLPPSTSLAGTNGHSTALRFNIGRDSLERAIIDLPEDQAGALQRFWRYCNDRNIDRKRLGTLLKKSNGDFYSSDSIYQVLTGRRTEAGNSLEPIIRSIDAFLCQVEPSTGASKFLKTHFAEMIWDYCDKVHARKEFGLVFGDNSMGKTDAVVQLCRRDHRRLYTQMTTRGHLTNFLQRAARTLAMGDRQTAANLRHRITEALPDQWIVDESHQCFQAIRNTLGLSTLEFIREIWDQRRLMQRPMSVVLVMDHYGRDRLFESKLLKKLVRRCYRPLQLPNMLDRHDLNVFSRAVGLPAARNEEEKVTVKLIDRDGNEHSKSCTENPFTLQREVIKAHGLHVWKSILDDAAQIARDQRREITWGAVIKAHAIFEADRDYKEQEKANDEEAA
jgi:hypothetical protein